MDNCHILLALVVYVIVLINYSPAKTEPTIPASPKGKAFGTTAVIAEIVIPYNIDDLTRYKGMPNLTSIYYKLVDIHEPMESNGP